MSTKGPLTREAAIDIVGREAVEAVEAAAFEPTDRVQTDGDTRLEFAASIDCVARDGRPVRLRAYAYQQRADVGRISATSTGPRPATT
ncbi:MAG TPA: hypothetical protein VFD92_01235 [Candidatus Binatia bacterium]|nr:hypothetical protein [Candidatus Binatia bacterium]